MSMPDRAPHVFRKAGTADHVIAGDVVAAGAEAQPDRYDFVVKHEDTRGRYSLVDMVLNPAFDSSPGHSHHQHSEMLYLISGRVGWTVEGETQVLGSGDLVCIPPFAITSPAPSEMNRPAC